MYVFMSIPQLGLDSLYIASNVTVMLLQEIAHYLVFVIVLDMITRREAKKELQTPHQRLLIT